MQHGVRTALILTAALAGLLWLAPGPVLGVFAAALLAVGFRALAIPVARWTGLAPGWAVLLVALLLLVVLGVGAWLAGATLAEQADRFLQDLPATVQGLRDRVASYGWGRWVLERLGPEQAAPAAQQTAALAATAVGGLVDALGNVLLVLLLALYLATDPERYRNGALALLAPEARARGRLLLDQAGEALRGWLTGQAFAMLFSGTFAGLGLWLLGAPLSALLGLLIGLFTFVPYVGPLIAAAVVVLVTLGQDASLVPWVIGLLLLVEGLEGNVLTPMVQNRTAHLPPAVLLGMQLLLGTAFGVLGILLAAPLAAVTLVVVRVAYVEGWVERG